MKNQALFSVKDKSKKLKCHLLQFLFGALKVNKFFLIFSNIFTWQTYNALFIIRSVCKYLVEHLTEELLIQQFEAKPPGSEGTSEKL